MTPYQTSNVMAQAIESVQAPMQNFIDHGLWDTLVFRHWRDRQNSVPPHMVRHICRAVASELKRPFIQCQGYFLHGGWERNPHDPSGKAEYREYEAPRFHSGYIQIPKRKYLESHAAIFTLNASDDYMDQNIKFADRGLSCFWMFQTTNERLWQTMHTVVVTDPELRAARRAPPLPEGFSMDYLWR
jgi:hypothetical protein